MLPSEFSDLSRKDRDAAIRLSTRGGRYVGRTSPAGGHRVLFVPDIHAPYHSEPMLEEVLDEAKRVETIILLGDVLDAYDISSFVRDPRRRSFREEVDEAKGVLRRFRERNKLATIHFIEGNHEERFARYRRTNAPAFEGLLGMSIEEQLDLEAQRIIHHPRFGFVFEGRRMKHGDLVRSESGRTAKAEMDAHRCSGMSAHTHRLGQSSFMDKEGRLTEWWEAGHVCDVAQAEYVPSPNWVAGYLRGKILDDGRWKVEPVYL